MTADSGVWRLDRAVRGTGRVMGLGGCALRRCGDPTGGLREFYRRSADGCLRAVLVSVGDLDTAQDLVDEAFARAWASWRTVSGHPAPARGWSAPR